VPQAGTSPKALVIGPLVPDFDMGYNLAVARALEGFGYLTETLGFYVTTPPGWRNRLTIDLPALAGVRHLYDAYVASFNRQVLASYAAFQPDLVLVIRGSKLTPETLHAMRASVRVVWFHDAVARSQIDAERLGCFDNVYVFEADDVDAVRSQFGMAAHFLPLAFDPQVYRPLPEVAQDLDLAFIGTYYPERRALFEWLAGRFPKLIMRFYGRHVRYREPATWRAWARYQWQGQGGTFVNSSLQPREINQTYARARLCLNAHHAQSRLGCNPRVFEILGAGATQLVDELPFVQSQVGEGVLSYRDRDQLAAVIASALGDPVARARVARRGRELVLDSHTFAHRVRHILDHHGLARQPVVLR
jgi:spore maturation protein CgeB